MLSDLLVAGPTPPFRVCLTSAGGDVHLAPVLRNLETLAPAGRFVLQIGSPEIFEAIPKIIEKGYEICMLRDEPGYALCGWRRGC